MSKTLSIYHNICIDKMRKIVNSYFKPEKPPQLNEKPYNGLVELYCRIIKIEYPNPYYKGFVNKEGERFNSPIYTNLKEIRQKENSINISNKKSKPKKKEQNRSGEWWNKYRAYMKSKEWDEFKIRVKKIRGNKCEKCNSNKFILDVHHLTYERLGNEWVEDVQVLCRPCHRAQHKRKF